jgi:hypothetical protein
MTRRGDSFRADVKELDKLIDAARELRRNYAELRCDYAEQEWASIIARILDMRNSNSPSTNGLLAIAITRLSASLNPK